MIVSVDQLLALIKELKDDEILSQNKKIKYIIAKAEDVEFDIEFYDL